MKKLLLAAVLGVALTFCGIAAAEDYIMTPGDQLQIYVVGHPDISSARANSDSSYTVRPDGKMNFPLVGEIDTNGLTVPQFTEILTERLSEYIINPKITVNVAKLGTTRVFVLGEVKKQGMYELVKGHRVMDALGAADGFTPLSAKSGVYLIRRNDRDNVQKLNVNRFLRKGDVSQNVVLQEGDCLYLTSNHKVSLNDILLAASRAANTWYYIDRTKNN
ncbi:MAG: polysaccharide export protein [Acidaminococcaceae bacterium]|nr:polysaccharide export protein [Acidaminococcaceae bacterium]